MAKDPKFYHYNTNLKEFARELRKHSTLSEVILWNEVLKGRKLGYQFHRQRTISNYIGDFFCKDLKLFIELDGATHHEEKVQQKDYIKEKEIESDGYTLLRFKDEVVVAELGKVKERLMSWIKEYETAHPEVLKYKERRKRNLK